MLSPGKQLEELCSQADYEVILIAPFIKAAALSRLMSVMSDTAKLSCITRWRPEEVIAGVSDLEVWSILKNRSHTSLWLRSDLHAKYYRVDNECLIGSANITAKALGWSIQSNLELLVPLPSSNSQLIDFENKIFAGSVQVEETIFEQMQETVKLLKNQYQDIYPAEVLPEHNFVDTLKQNISSDCWLPTLRNPEDLHLAYHGRWEVLSTASREAALLDLRFLQVPPSLSKLAFHSYIGTLLLQNPIISQVDSFSETPQRFGAITSLLSSLPCGQVPDFDADRAWQTLMRWLCYFLSNRYTLSVPKHSEIFSRIKR